MSRPATYVLAILVITTVILADRLTKHEASVALRGRPPVTCVGGLVTLRYAENPGAMLGLGASLPGGARFWILTAGVSILLLGLLGVLLFGRTRTPLLTTALGLMIGGGATNMYDRLVNEGRVVDFMTLGAGPLRTGVFNAADVAISAGVVLFLISSLRHRRGARP